MKSQLFAFAISLVPFAANAGGYWPCHLIGDPDRRKECFQSQSFSTEYHVAAEASAEATIRFLTNITNSQARPATAIICKYPTGETVVFQKAVSMG